MSVLIFLLHKLITQSYVFVKKKLGRILIYKAIGVIFYSESYAICTVLKGFLNLQVAQFNIL